MNRILVVTFSLIIMAGLILGLFNTLVDLSTPSRDNHSDDPNSFSSDCGARPQPGTTTAQPPASVHQPCQTHGEQVRRHPDADLTGGAPNLVGPHLAAVRLVARLLKP
jgi:hypothetical protein